MIVIHGVPPKHQIYLIILSFIEEIEIEIEIELLQSWAIYGV